VTASTLEDARDLLRSAAPELAGFGRVHWAEILESLNTAGVVTDVDVRLLDKGVVIPNMGVVIDRGVWWPKIAALR
jgi:hypothetical protein